MLRQPESLQPRRAARRVLADEHKVAQVGRQHQPVAPPVAADLGAPGGEPGVVLRRLDLDRAALRRLAFARAALLDLLRRVEAEIGMARALVGKLADAEHLRLERGADRVEQGPERRMVGELPGRPAGRADSPQLGEIRLDRRRRFRARSRHRPVVAQRAPTRKRGSAHPGPIRDEGGFFSRPHHTLTLSSREAAYRRADGSAGPSPNTATMGLLRRRVVVPQPVDDITK